MAASLAVFLPLNLVRYAVLSADDGAFVLAITITVLAHLVLAAVCATRAAAFGLAPARPGDLLLVAWLALVVFAEIVSGRVFEVAFGETTLLVTGGGFFPSLLIGPLFSLPLAARMLARPAPAAA